MTVADVLADARALVEGGWCRTNEAEQADWTPTGYDSDNAVRFCSTAAIMRAADGPCADGEAVWSGRFGLNCYVALGAFWSATHAAVAGHEGVINPRSLAVLAPGAQLIDSIALWERHLDRKVDDVLAAFTNAIGYAQTWSALVEEEKARLLEFGTDPIGDWNRHVYGDVVSL